MTLKDLGLTFWLDKVVFTLLHSFLAMLGCFYINWIVSTDLDLRKVPRKRLPSHKRYYF